MTAPAALGDFGAFYERTYPAAFRTALGIAGDRALADDVTQDAFVAAYRQRGRYRGDGPAEAWLQRIVVNTAISSLRRRSVRWIAPLDPERHDRPVADAAASIADRLLLERGLAALNPKQRAAIVLRYYHDYDYATIATILETSTGNVGALLSRALDGLRRHLGDSSMAIAAAEADRG